MLLVAGLQHCNQSTQRLERAPGSLRAQNPLDYRKEDGVQHQPLTRQDGQNHRLVIGAIEDGPPWVGLP